MTTQQLAQTNIVQPLTPPLRSLNTTALLLQQPLGPLQQLILTLSLELFYQNITHQRLQQQHLLPQQTLVLGRKSILQLATQTLNQMTTLTNHLLQPLVVICLKHLSNLSLQELLLSHVLPERVAASTSLLVFAPPHPLLPTTPAVAVTPNGQIALKATRLQPLQFQLSLQSRIDAAFAHAIVHPSKI